MHGQPNCSQGIDSLASSLNDASVPVFVELRHLLPLKLKDFPRGRVSERELELS